MKRKIIICTIVLTTLLLSGCTQKPTQGAENTSTPESATPSADVSQPTSLSRSNTVQNTPRNTVQNATQNTVQNNSEETNMISEDEAKEIALSHAGLTADQVTFIKSGIDRDNGRINYDVEFYTNDRKEYDYEIDPYTGEVLDYDYDAEYYTQPSNPPESTGTSEAQSITADEARQIALSQVPGATLQDIREFESDYDDTRLEFEGKIYYDQKEYEFVIDSSGTILEWDVEPIYGGGS